MVEYLVILLSNNCTSYCYYNSDSEKDLIPIDTLREAIKYAMKENWMIQFVYPNTILPQEYLDAIDSIDHNDIVPSDSPYADVADVVVFNDWGNIKSFAFKQRTSYVLRIDKQSLYDNASLIESTLAMVERLNIVITDSDTFTNEDQLAYAKFLDSLSTSVLNMFINGKFPKTNILTDRISLREMNNCDACIKNITLAPDGNFYACPAFYLERSPSTLGLDNASVSIGCLNKGLDVNNKQLYDLQHAPLCRTCDAYQCKRCVWLNRKNTYDVNTPAKEQCVISNLERNASRKLLAELRCHCKFSCDVDIKEIDYLDPFDVYKKQMN